VAAEVVVEVDLVAAAEAQAARDRAAVAAVQQRHDLARAAAGHLAADELRRQRGRVEVGDLRVRRREVELAAVVLQAVAGEVQEQQVVAAAVGEEGRDLAAQHRLGLVDRQLDREVADLRVVEDARERLRVAGRGPEAAQLLVAVGAVRDDERVAAGQRLRLRVAGDERVDQPALVLLGDATELDPVAVELERDAASAAPRDPAPDRARHDPESALAERHQQRAERDHLARSRALGRDGISGPLHVLHVELEQIVAQRA
jgi:hypothetical protein